jgi:hypothetical protein
VPPTLPTLYRPYIGHANAHSGFGTAHGDCVLCALSNNGEREGPPGRRRSAESFRTKATTDLLAVVGAACVPLSDSSEHKEQQSYQNSSHDGD